MKKLLSILVLACSFILVGCGGGASGPGQTVKDFAYAMEAGDANKVGQIMPSMKAMLGEEKLKGMMTEAAADMKKKGGIKSVTIDKEEVNGDSAKVTATIETGDGNKDTDDFTLSKVDGKWVITLGDEAKGPGGPEGEGPAINLNPEQPGDAPALPEIPQPAAE